MELGLDFVVIGTQKGGTTSLWSYLRSHPDVFTPEIKEPNFFIEEGTWNRGLEWYRSLFSGRSASQVGGEASPGYTMFPIFSGAAERMASIAPHVKLIYLIRDPLDRMVSSWLQSRADGLDDRPLREALLLDIRYVSLSQYAMQIERYLEHFDRDALLVLRAEDLAEDPGKVVTQVSEFIGVHPGGVTADVYERHNVSAARMVPRRRTLVATRLLERANRHDLAFRLKMAQRSVTHRSLNASELEFDDDLRQRMRTYLEPDMIRLRDIVGPEMDLWGYA